VAVGRLPVLVYEVVCLKQYFTSRRGLLFHLLP
jgi:hypothetical protein